MEIAIWLAYVVGSTYCFARLAARDISSEMDRQKAIWYGVLVGSTSAIGSTVLLSYMIDWPFVLVLGFLSGLLGAIMPSRLLRSRESLDRNVKEKRPR